MPQQSAPPPPAPARPAEANVVTTRVLGSAPMSREDVAALQARRELLSDQLVSANGRRRELSRQARAATGADKAGLEQRIGVLDARLARLETEIDETGKLLASAPAAYTASQESKFTLGPKGQLDHNIVPIVSVVSVFVLFPLALAYARILWRRGSAGMVAGPDRATAERLERMEQAMDAIAIEIERVSEGQRFVTRLLGEQRAGIPIAAGASDADPRRAPADDRQPR